MPVNVTSIIPNSNRNNHGKTKSVSTSNVRRNHTHKNKKNIITPNTITKIKLNSTIPESEIHTAHMSRTSSRNMKQSTDEYNQAPMYDFPVHLTEDNESYNDGTRSIEQSEKRASYYLQYMKEYFIPKNDSINVPDEQVEGLLVHYPGQRPMAFDSKTTFQHGLFNMIRGSLTEENKPILLITHKGLQEVSLEDINNKYKKILSKLFLS